MRARSPSRARYQYEESDPTRKAAVPAQAKSRIPLPMRCTAMLLGLPKACKRSQLVERHGRSSGAVCGVAWAGTRTLRPLGCARGGARVQLGLVFAAAAAAGAVGLVCTKGWLIPALGVRDLHIALCVCAFAYLLLTCVTFPLNWSIRLFWLELVWTWTARKRHERISPDDIPKPWYYYIFSAARFRIAALDRSYIPGLARRPSRLHTLTTPTYFANSHRSHG